MFPVLVAAEGHSLMYSLAGGAVWLVSYLMFGVLAVAVIFNLVQDAIWRRRIHKHHTVAPQFKLSRKVTSLRERFDRPIRPKRLGRRTDQPDSGPVDAL